jgi:hypothetical protein
MSARPMSDEEAVAAADKEMEARANRAKELLSQRYVGLKRQQVRPMSLGGSRIYSTHCIDSTGGFPSLLHVPVWGVWRCTFTAI